MRRTLIGAGALCLAMAACSSGGDTVDVELGEWVVNATPSSASAGEITFKADNQGAETHELVIVRAGSADDLPVDENGKVLEDELPAGAFIGEIEEFDAGTSEEATFDLDAGTYILFCNILEEEDDGTFESHFQEGMRTTLTVES